MSGGGHNEAKFKAAILALSTSTDWDEAKAEWELDASKNRPILTCRHIEWCADLTKPGFPLVSAD